MDAVERRIDGRGKLGVAATAMVAMLAAGGGCQNSGGNDPCRSGCDEQLAVVAGAAALAGFVAGLLLLSDDCGGHVSHSGSYCSPSSPATNYDLVRSWKCDR